MAKLHILTAERAPIAVILRRGPSRWYHVIRWDMLRNDFEHGAWIKGRIYEDKCDLSPDGQLLVYFVHQGSRVWTNYSSAWTAVSRVPWLEAITLWPQGTTYHGGGRWLDNQTLYRDTCDHLDCGTHPDHPNHYFREVTRPPVDKPRPRGVDGADWTGYDHRGHVIFTMGDQLFRRRGTDDDCLADFSNLRPNPQPAPREAARPPRRLNQKKKRYQF